ncbi:MAG: hypothetical protein WCQ95_10390 [Bacteroidota bacterium]
MEEQNTNTQPQTNVQPPVPGAIGALVFSIISLVLCWYFWFPVVGLIFNILCLVFGIMAMGKGKKAMAAYEATPDQFKKGSYSIAKIGKILGLVGLILNALLLIVAIVFTFVLGGAIMHNM